MQILEAFPLLYVCCLNVTMHTSAMQLTTVSVVTAFSPRESWIGDPGLILLFDNDVTSIVHCFRCDQVLPYAGNDVRL